MEEGPLHRPLEMNKWAPKQMKQGDGRNSNTEQESEDKASVADQTQASKLCSYELHKATNWNHPDH